MEEDGSCFLDWALAWLYLATKLLGLELLNGALLEREVPSLTVSLNIGS